MTQEEASSSDEIRAQRVLLCTIVVQAVFVAGSSTLLPAFTFAAIRGSPGSMKALTGFLAAMWVVWMSSSGTIDRIFKTKLIHRLPLDRYPSDVAKPQVVLAHPHGIFTLATNAFLPSGMRMFSDTVFLSFPGMFGGMIPSGIRKHLLVESPYVKTLIRRVSENEALSLTHPNIERVMSEMDGDLGVYAGGFEEIANHSTARLCTSRWGYWVRQALRRGHDITFYYVLGSETLFSPTPSKLSDFTQWLIGKGINVPLIAPGGILWPEKTSHPMAPMFYRHKLPHIPDPDATCVAHYTAEFRAGVHTQLDRIFNEIIPRRPELLAMKWRRPTLSMSVSRL